MLRPNRMLVERVVRPYRGNLGVLSTQQAFAQSSLWLLQSAYLPCQSPCVSGLRVGSVTGLHSLSVFPLVLTGTSLPTTGTGYVCLPVSTKDWRYKETRKGQDRDPDHISLVRRCCYAAYSGTSDQAKFDLSGGSIPSHDPPVSALTLV